MNESLRGGRTVSELVCSSCGNVQPKGKVYRKNWSKAKPCGQCGATSWKQKI